MGFLSNLFNLDSWQLINLDTGEKVQGQYHAENLVENISSKYETHTSLGRQNPIAQFINGDPHTISFEARVFEDVRLGELNLSDIPINVRPPFPGEKAGSLVGKNLKDKLNILKTWARRDKELGRPPLLAFYIGDGTEIAMEQCVITSLGGITYGRPKANGAMRDVTISINLLAYHDHRLETPTLFETRYHNVAEGQYYEMLTYIEYKDPNLGDIIRKRHPTQPTLAVGDTVKLPSQEAIQSDKVTQTSIALKDGWGKKDSPQKRLRQQVLENRNRAYISHIIVED